MRRFLLLLITLLSTATFTFAEEVTVAIAGNKFSGSTSSGSYTSDGFTFTIDKGSNTNNINLSTTDHLRIFQGSNFSVSSNNGEIITKLVITATTASYAKLDLTSENGSGSWNDTKYTWTGEATTISFKSTTAQSRINKVEITYTEAGGSLTNISFSKSEVELTYGDIFTPPSLEKADGLTIDWKSSDSGVATVDEEGTVLIVGVGETTITATEHGNIENSDSYTIKVNPKAGNLSYYAETFIVLKDADFVAPVLTNPNDLTVAYKSDNEEVAVVDENTGEVIVKTNEAGVTVTITATATPTAENNFFAGKASYTIVVKDEGTGAPEVGPSVKFTEESFTIIKAGALVDDKN